MDLTLAVDREMSCSQEENKTAMLRFQKILTPQQKKLKAISSRNWRFPEDVKKYCGTNIASLINYSLE